MASTPFYGNSEPCFTLGDASKALRELLYPILMVDPDAKQLEISLDGVSGSITAIWMDSKSEIKASRIFHAS